MVGFKLALYNIFKLESSATQDKTPNRDIRNELVGHPIRRDKTNKKKLVSTVLWHKDGSNNNSGSIHYYKYSIEKNFQPEEIEIEIEDILQSHYDLLVKYLDKIIHRLRRILNCFDKKLAWIDSLVDNRIEFTKLEKIISNQFNVVCKVKCLFRTPNILQCFDKKDVHPRYSDTVCEYYQTIKECVSDFKNHIIEINASNEKRKKKRARKIMIDIIDNIDCNDDKMNVVDVTKKRKDFSYEMSKLHERTQLFYIKIMRDEFYDRKEIVEELDNMSININDDVEYYCSFYYLEKLLGND